jgi:hypothetical protein
VANNFTDYLEAAIGQHFLRTGAAVAQPTSLTVALYTVDPGETGAAGTEVSGGSYARQTITFTTGTSGTTATRFQNSALITFPTATAGWGTVVSFGIFDNSGNMLVYGSLTTSKLVNNGDQFTIASGSLTVDID